MAFLSLVGRVLFVSVFLGSAWLEFKEFGVDGGSAEKPHTSKFMVAGAIALKALGSLFFIYGNTIAATLLILHQFIATPVLFTQSLSLLGGLIFFIGRKKPLIPDPRELHCQRMREEERIESEILIECMRDELIKARSDSEMLFGLLNDTQKKLAQSKQEIKGLKRKLSADPHAERSR